MEPHQTSLNRVKTGKNLIKPIFFGLKPSFCPAWHAAAQVPQMGRHWASRAAGASAGA